MKQLHRNEAEYVDGIVRACAWCEKENELYAEYVNELCAVFKAQISHTICAEHNAEENKKLTNLFKNGK